MLSKNYEMKSEKGREVQINADFKLRIVGIVVFVRSSELYSKKVRTASKMTSDEMRRKKDRSIEI